MWLRREDPFLLRDVLLEDVRLQGPIELFGVKALTFRRHHHHGEDRHCRTVDRHRGGDVTEWDSPEKHVGVTHRVNRYAAMPDLAESSRIVAVAPHERRHVERH